MLTSKLPKVHDTPDDTGCNSLPGRWPLPKGFPYAHHPGTQQPLTGNNASRSDEIGRGSWLYIKTY